MPGWLELVFVAVVLIILVLRRASMSRPTIIGWVAVGSMFAIFAVDDSLFQGRARSVVDIFGFVLLVASQILWSIGLGSKRVPSRRRMLYVVLAVVIVLFSVFLVLHQ